MSDEASDHPPSLPAAAHRPIRIVRPLRQRNLAETAKPSDYLFGQGMFLVALLAVIAFARGAPTVGSVLVLVTVLPAIRTFWSAARVERESRDEFFSLRADRFKFCPDCGYDLRGSADEGPCPECAALYDLEFLEQTWTLSYKPSVTVMSDNAQFGELRSINEGRQRRYQSYQNTNKTGDSPATPRHPS